jgi:hypothetical protein
MQGSVTFVQPLHDLKREGKGTIRFGNRPARAPIPSDPSCISVFDHPSPRCSRVILVACVDLGTMHPFTRLSRHPLDTRSQANDLVRQCGVLTANTDRAVWVPVPDIGVGRTGCLGPPFFSSAQAGLPHTALRSMVHLPEDRQFRTWAVTKECHPRSVTRACALLQPSLLQGCQHALAPNRSFHPWP